MGCRGTIAIYENSAAPRSAEAPVVLYTHWGAKRMLGDLVLALKRKERWNDPPYLSRIIFCEMIAGDYNGTIGYGIQTRGVGDAEEEIVVDCSEQQVIRNRTGHERQIFTFKELIGEEGFDVDVDEDGPFIVVAEEYNNAKIKKRLEEEE